MFVFCGQPNVLTGSRGRYMQLIAHLTSDFLGVQYGMCSPQ